MKYKIVIFTNIQLKSNKHRYYKWKQIKIKFRTSCSVCKYCVIFHNATNNWVNVHATTTWQIECPEHGYSNNLIYLRYPRPKAISQVSFFEENYFMSLSPSILICEARINHVPFVYLTRMARRYHLLRFRRCKRMSLVLMYVYIVEVSLLGVRLSFT